MRTINPKLKYLLKRLDAKYPSKVRIAEALGLSYTTVAHWYDGRSLPNFETTMLILDALGEYRVQGE